MVLHQSNKVWNVNGTYTLQEIANQHIKPQQQIHLQSFPTKGEACDGLCEIKPEEFNNVLVDGEYNRAVEHFYYTTLYNNLKRRGGFNYASASGIIAYLRLDGTIVIVAGVHRCVYLLLKGLPIFVELHKHSDGLSLNEMKKLEAEVYTDEGYHLSKQTAEQALKAAFVAREKWAVDFSDTLKRANLKVKTLGSQEDTALKLHGHKGVIDTIEKYKCESNLIEATEYTNVEFSDEGKVEANFLCGIAILLKYEDSNIESKYLTSAVSTANTLIDGFKENLPHGLTKETMALRFAFLYNQVVQKRKTLKGLDLPKLMVHLKMKPSHIAFDSFMSGNGLKSTA
jgi:hypothetical protein